MFATIAWCFMAAMSSAMKTSLLPVAVMDMSASASTVREPGDLEALHRGLQCADRVDLGADHPCALPAQRLCTALTDVTETGLENSVRQLELGLH